MRPMTVNVIYNMTMKYIFNPVTIFSILNKLIINFTHLCFHGCTLIKAELGDSSITAL